MALGHARCRVAPGDVMAGRIAVRRQHGIASAGRQGAVGFIGEDELGQYFSALERKIAGDKELALGRFGGGGGTNGHGVPLQYAAECALVHRLRTGSASADTQSARDSTPRCHYMLRRRGATPQGR